jgi:hypothetical protein
MCAYTQWVDVPVIKVEMVKVEMVYTGTKIVLKCEFCLVCDSRKVI